MVKGISAHKEKIQEYLDKCLMLVTALNPVIGYDKSAAIAQKAYRENKTLKRGVPRVGISFGKRVRRACPP